MTDRYSTAGDLAADLRQYHARSNSLPVQPGDGRGEGEQSRSQTSSPSKVIPKGLRSFDAHDADFFLQLLPGPTDRDGLPETLRFWKTRIEQTDADATFAVGLIYGPSGCGKSSLMKAGLLPRLAPHVLPVYLEATADDTEARLLKALRKRLPDLTASDLPAAIAELRSGTVLSAGQKLLIVLDQFEQWLHAHGDLQTTELVRALRQSDGGHVQCVVMVRDDFWLAASQFSRDLEIRLVEGENSAAVYLFDAPHARRVLTLFGRAYGCLQPASGLSPQQSQFIDQAVAELADDGKVIPVRLALFAEMVKGKPWNPATLKQIGGIAGVGATFLEETFGATTAPPQHRLHQKAAQAVLKALLPQAGADIRGHKRSQTELLEASGYAARPQEFAELMRILDAELRLITPADDEEGRMAFPGRPESPRSEIQSSYQLTHDYLVPSLRDWLTRKQRETRRGRAELRLAERAAAYNAQPDARHLPGWWEWPNILLLTRRRNWNPAERRVMRAAGRRRGLQAMLAVVLLVAGTLAGREARRRVNEDRDRVTADGIVQRLLEAPLATVPADADELEPYRRWTDAKLRQVLADDRSNAEQRLRASIGLLPIDPAQAEPIFQAMLKATPEDAQVLADVLAPHSSQFVERLWDILANESKPPFAKLRAAMALASYAPPDIARERWESVAPLVVNQFIAEVSVNPSYYWPIQVALQPAAQALLPSLAVVFWDGDGNASQRTVAAIALAQYTSDDIESLATIANDADPWPFVNLFFPALKRHTDAAIAQLQGELDKHAAPHWHDPPLDSSWQMPDDSTVARIEAAGGILTERFALLQTLPLDDFSSLAEELRPSGYRPLRCRPYEVGDRLQVACVWTRDAVDWRMAVNVTADELLRRNADFQNANFVPVDVAGYSTKDDTRFIATWSAESGSREQWRMYVELPSAVPPDADELRQSRFVPASLHTYVAPDGAPRFALIWRTEKRGFDWEMNGDLSAVAYEAAVATDRLQVDVSLTVAPSVPVPKVDVLAALDEAEKTLADNPDDLGALFSRGIARYNAADDAGAIEDLTLVAENDPKSAAAF
ncbi:MAG TPA: hypothetical protein VFI31_27055, partial [Pirellulales bacterium]|nr:hypothetical protein [Pirellulales bacterium]